MTICPQLRYIRAPENTWKAKSEPKYYVWVTDTINAYFKDEVKRYALQPGPLIVLCTAIYGNRLYSKIRVPAPWTSRKGKCRGASIFYPDRMWESQCSPLLGNPQIALVGFWGPHGELYLGNKEDAAVQCLCEKKGRMWIQESYPSLLHSYKVQSQDY